MLLLLHALIPWLLQPRCTPYHRPPSPPVLGMGDLRSTYPRTSRPPVHLSGPRGSTYSRMSGFPPEQVDPHPLGYGLLARGPDGWSAGPVTSLGLGLGLGLGARTRG